MCACGSACVCHDLPHAIRQTLKNLNSFGPLETIPVSTQEKGWA